MEARPLTPATRARFRARQYERMVPRLSFGLVAGAVLFIAFTAWDELCVAGAGWRSLPMRVLISATLLGLAVLLRLRSVRPYPHVILVAAVVTATSGITLFASMLPESSQSAAASLTLMLMLVGVLSPPPRVAGLAAGVVLPIADGLGYLLDMTALSFSSINLFAGSAAIIAVLIARVNHEAAERAFRFELELEELATIDALTGALNRRAFLETGSRVLQRAAGGGKPVSVFLLDLDHFKRVNDTRGHAAGDEALRTVSRVCREHLRPEDALGRLGGEELAVLLPGADRDAAAAVAERLRVAIAGASVSSDSGSFHVTTSIGVATARGGDVPAVELLKRADAALYSAKAGGRNRVVLESEPAPAA